MNDFNYRFDYNIRINTLRQKSNMLLLILGYFDGDIYIKMAYPVAKYTSLGKHTSHTIKQNCNVKKIKILVAPKPIKQYHTKFLMSTFRTRT